MEYRHEANQPQPEITSHFPYSPDNPPNLQDLANRVYAVHTTPILPEDNVMVAGARNIRPDAHWQDETTSFRPTIHFALGEVVQGHDGHTWDDQQYAVVAPLGSLEDQLVNVLPHDTFVLGNVVLTPDMTVIAPDGTDLSGMIAETTTYRSGEQLRDAVNRVIAEKGGWPIRMQDKDVTIDTPATARWYQYQRPSVFWCTP